MMHRVCRQGRFLLRGNKNSKNAPRAATGINSNSNNNINSNNNSNNNSNSNGNSCGYHSSARVGSNNNNSYQYEYPTRTEAPTITRTMASSLPTAGDDASHSDSNSNTNNNNNNNNKEQIAKVALRANQNQNQVDHFDDCQSLSFSQQSDIRTKQRSLLNTALPSSFAIQTTPPSTIPPNLPLDSLSKPATQISTLDNGLRVASQETYGQVCTFGIISNCGSRLETNASTNANSNTGTNSNTNTGTTGVNHLMELLAFCGTDKLDSTSYQNTLDTLGGVSFASSSREQFLYCIDVLRPNIDQAMDMLQDVVLHPSIDDQVVEDMKRVIEFQWMDIMPEILLSEGLQMAGYGHRNDNGLHQQQQQLGRAHFCPLEALPSLNAQTIIDFRNKHLLNPQSMVIAGAGIEHEHLVSLAQQHFGHLQRTTTTPSSTNIANPNEPNDENSIIHSTYTGGSHRQTTPTPDGFTRVALAFPTGGWHSDDLVPSCVLQTLLGGGSSFSAGGPGKGMYSRLYRQVLNRYYWSESCEAFTSFHSESGLLGISGSSIPEKAGDMTRVLAENMHRLAVDLVEDEELDRARNMLKCNVLTQLESRLVLFEDVGRQILTYDRREDSREMCDKIDAVTKEDLRDLARASVIGMKPTLCAVGDDIDKVPQFEEVERWFNSL